jgi:hypothetical protein
MAVQEPRPGLYANITLGTKLTLRSGGSETYVIRLEANGNVIAKLTDADDVAPRRVDIVVRGLASGSNHVECMLCT